MTQSLTQRLALIIAVGYGMTVAIWALGYVSLMQPGLLIGEGLFVLMLLVMLAGGIVISRYAGGTSLDGAGAGAFAGLFNIMIVGALIGGDTPPSHVVMWLGGNFGVPIVLGAAGVLIGRTRLFALRETNNNPDFWYGVFTKLTIVAVFLLLISGGIVTAHQAGLAVPDWPQSFGHNMILYPLAEMVSEESIREGVHYEHAHRLYGMLIGCTAILLVLTVRAFHARPWLLWLSITLLALVIVQGVLGGTRVTEQALALALVHGVFGQVVFGMFGIIAAATSVTWLSGREKLTPNATKELRMTLVLIGLLIFQLILGATYRHLKFDEEIASGMVNGILHLHILMAFVVAGHGLVCGFRAWGTHRDVPVLPLIGLILVTLLIAQIVLGFMAWVTVLAYDKGNVSTTVQAIVTTSHQATGALILLTATLLAVWTGRLLRPQ